MKLAAVLAAPALLGAVAVESRGAALVDQSNTPVAWTSLMVDFYAPMGQEFVPNHTGIGFVDLYLGDGHAGFNADVDFQVRIRNDAIGGTVLGTSQIVRVPDTGTGFGAYQRFQFATPVSVIPGNRYVLEPVLVTTGPERREFGMYAGQTNTYLSGRPIVNSSATTNTNDFLFRSGRNTNTGPAASGTFGAFAYRGIRDVDHDGDGDALQSGSFVARNDQQSGLNPPSEDRAVFEYDVARFAGVQSASISGTLFANNSLDTGPRTVRLELFDGDGNITVSDFQIAAAPSGTFTYQPPADSNVPFNIDITAQLNALLAGGADFLGARFTPTADQAHSVFSDQTGTPVLNVVIPEPGAIGLAAMALGAGLLRRRCGRSA